MIGWCARLSFRDAVYRIVSYRNVVCGLFFVAFFIKMFLLPVPDIFCILFAHPPASGVSLRMNWNILRMPQRIVESDVRTVKPTTCVVRKSRRRINRWQSDTRIGAKYVAWRKQHCWMLDKKVARVIRHFGKQSNRPITCQNETSLTNWKVTIRSRCSSTVEDSSQLVQEEKNTSIPANTQMAWIVCHICSMTLRQCINLFVEVKSKILLRMFCVTVDCHCHLVCQRSEACNLHKQH